MNLKKILLINSFPINSERSFIFNLELKIKNLKLRSNQDQLFQNSKGTFKIKHYTMNIEH